MTDYKGFLTPGDRLFLQGQKQYESKQGRYERRESIRHRTRQAFYDFALLHQELERAERNKIFDPPAEETADLMKAMIETVAFLYHSLEGDAGSKAVDWGRTFRYPFAQVLKAGVQHGEMARHRHNEPDPFAGIVDVTFDVEVSRAQLADQDRVVEDLAENDGYGLTDEELRATIVHAAREPDQLRHLADRIEEERDGDSTDD